jgi:hypothetical protein
MRSSLGFVLSRLIRGLVERVLINYDGDKGGDGLEHRKVNPDPWLERLLGPLIEGCAI